MVEYLDLDSFSGIGNAVLLLVTYFLECSQREQCGVVKCNSPALLQWLRLGWCRVVQSVEADWTAKSKEGMCCLRALYLGRNILKALVYRPKDAGRYAGRWAAGFCIRTADPRHDGTVVFMNPVAVATMIDRIREYAPKPVLVCSNDSRNLRNLPDNAEVLELTDPASRNQSSHWQQWFALASCPRVYHGVSSPEDRSVTSTFAPTAAIYGDAQLVGVDNTGAVYEGGSYRW
jgi:hypothetical protein